MLVFLEVILAWKSLSGRIDRAVFLATLRTSVTYNDMCGRGGRLLLSCCTHALSSSRRNILSMLAIITHSSLLIVTRILYPVRILLLQLAPERVLTRSSRRPLYLSLLLYLPVRAPTLLPFHPTTTAPCWLEER